MQYNSYSSCLNVKHMDTKWKTLTKKHSINGEVTSTCIKMPVMSKFHFCMTTICDNIYPQGCYFKIFLLSIQNN